MSMTLSDRLHHVAVEVSNLDAAIAWYEDYLEFTFERRFRLEEAQIEIAYLSTSAVRIELLRRGVDRRSASSGGAAEPAQRMHICFDVDDIEAAADELRRRGIRLAQEPRFIEPANLKNCWIEDLEGNLIEFVESLAPLPPKESSR